MDRKLSKPPLTYVLAQIKISQILDIEKFIPQLQEAIRKDFPRFDKFEIQSFEIKKNIDKEKFDVRQNTQTQWHFTDKTSTVGILVDNNSIMIHTSKYNSYNDLNETLQSILEKFHNILSISLYTRLGLRYINLIQSNVTEYIRANFNDLIINNNSYITKIDTAQNTDNGILKVQATFSSDDNMLKTNNPLTNIYLPFDLQQSANYLSFEHHKKNSSTIEYLMLDIDHFSEKEGDFDLSSILMQLEKLHEGIETAFYNAVTETALIDWK